VEKIKAEVLRYLGRREQIVPEELNGLVDECIALMRNTATFRQVHLSFPISNDNGRIYLATAGLLLCGNDIARRLSGCGQAVLLAATLGAEADALIRKWKRVDLTRSFVLDACATQLIEERCDEIQQQIRAEAAAIGLMATWRFSPGYGDLPLDIQPGILEALNAGRRIGLTCTEHFILLPRKSVTAVIGLRTSVDASQESGEQFFSNGCGGCVMCDTCSYRKDEA